MHILYIHQHFATPDGSTGTRSYEFARRWIKAGHKVTLITGHYDIGGLEAGRGLIKKQTIEAINVIVVGISYSNKQSFPRRIASFLCFMLLSIYVGLRTKKVDVIYATSTPLTVGITAMVLKLLKHTPFVFEVRDQWPEAPIEMGIIKNKILIKFLLWFERLIYKSSTAIVALSPGQAEGVKKVLAEDKPIVVVPNCCDTDVFSPAIDGSAVRKKMGWECKAVFLHAGAMGKTNCLNFVIDAADKLREQNDILFVLIGEGNQKPVLQSRARELNLTNVEILPSVPKHRLPTILAAADVVMAIIGKFSITEKHASLNKFFDAISAGKPVLLNYSGLQRKLLEDNSAGFGCELCNLDEFVERVLYLNTHRDELAKMGQNARRLAEDSFDRDALSMQALRVITNCISD